MNTPSYQRAKPILAVEALQRVPPGARQIVVPLTRHSGRMGDPLQTERWGGSPMMVFKPLGLLVFGAAEGSLVHAVRVGNQHQGVTDYGGVPARYFESGKTFEQVTELAAAGELGGSLEGRLLLELDHCEIGNTVGVETSGAVGNLCLWGLTYDGHRPSRDVRIWRETVSDREPSYRAEVVDRTLVGNRVRFGANTETEGAAVELVKAFLGGPY